MQYGQYLAPHAASHPVQHIHMDPSYFIHTPPPNLIQTPINIYQQHQTGQFYAPKMASVTSIAPMQMNNYNQPNQFHSPSVSYLNHHQRSSYTIQSQPYLTPNYNVQKRKFAEINQNRFNNNHNSYNNNSRNSRFGNNNNKQFIKQETSDYQSLSSSKSKIKTEDAEDDDDDDNDGSDDDDENDDEESEDESDEEIELDEDEQVLIDEDLDEDLNLIRERELNDLKCRSVCEKMSVFLKYYVQFKDTYMQRVQCISSECTDSLKLQFNSLIKYLNEFESLLQELNAIIVEHERGERVCKNNHRKTKKLFNKSKAFIRYECSKRLQTNIFEYRRLINAQDRYAGMYDLIEMNNYLTSLLPDIGVSIRRYINRCEKQKKQAELDEQEQEEDFENWNRQELGQNSESNPNGESEKKREYESFSTGIDSLNRYLLKRVEDEESLDELVKERIVKWINKRQSKYILIFSEVDKLLNQHKQGECHAKFHSFLQFNLGKLITVCDSYHQKLKELLYSTTIRRKKKRKKVKLLPEAMHDVFTEINDLKKTLEQTKLLIKKCNEIKNSLNHHQQQQQLQQLSYKASSSHSEVFTETAEADRSNVQDKNQHKEEQEENNQC
jgi:hypothetical protein